MEKANETRDFVKSIRLNKKDIQIITKVMKKNRSRSFSECVRMLFTEEANRIDNERKVTSWL